MPTPPASLPRYEIKAQLGEGATAVVYHAWDRDLGRPVALKVLKDVLEESDVARTRFRREAHAAAALAHANVVTVFDVGEAGGTPYIVMELVRGQPLSALLQERSLEARR